MHIPRILLTIIFKIIITVHAQYLQEYDRCSADNDRCRDLQSCKELHGPIKNGFRPKWCNPSEGRQIVCCSTNVEEPLVTDRRSSQMSISEMMCLIYLDDICSSTIQHAVGGTPAKAKELPFMARIGYNRHRGRISWQCGGSLISTNFVLSAAHCTHARGKKAKWVRLGELDISTTKDDAKPENFRIIDWINHPDYVRNRRYHDIALYKLERNVVFNEYIQPICLQQIDSLSRYKTVIASGWGHTEKGRASNTLIRVDLNLYNINTCKNLEDFNRLPEGLQEETQICSGVIEGGRDTCVGDSGGPLFLPSVNKKRGKCVLYTQIGVTAFGPTKCGLKNYAAIYTKVSAYREWIESVVWKEYRTAE